MSKYDGQIKELTENPELIENQWVFGEGLFAWIGNGPNVGCLINIRGEDNLNNKAYINGVFNEEITEQIKNDERIPKRMKDITTKDLPVFKEWMEKIDILNQK